MHGERLSLIYEGCKLIARLERKDLKKCSGLLHFNAEQEEQRRKSGTEEEMSCEAGPVLSGSAELGTLQVAYQAGVAQP